MTLNHLFSGRTLIVGFDGWSDSADAASGAVRYLTLQSKSEMIEQLELVRRAVANQTAVELKAYLRKAKSLRDELKYRT